MREGNLRSSREVQCNVKAAMDGLKIKGGMAVHRYL